MTKTITWKTKGKAKERPKDVKPTRTKEGRELVSFVIGNYFTHSLSNVTYMQIMRFNNNKRFRFSRQCNLPLNIDALSMLKNNTNMLPKKLNAKKQK